MIPTAILYRWLAIALVSIAFGGFCFVKGAEHDYAKWNADTVARQQREAKQETVNRTRERAWAQRVETAEHERTQLQITAKADADRARARNDSLQHDLDDTKRKLSTAPAEAVREYAAAVQDVFGDCVGEYRTLAEKATGHATDVKTLTDAWPVDTAGK